jgi:NTE family protein
MTKQALVLTGGGIKGAYQAGAIAEVIRGGFRPTSIYGISVGSINGGMLASYVGGDPEKIVKAAEDVQDYWRNEVTDFTKLGHARWKPIILWEVLFGNFKGMINVDGAINIIQREIKQKNVEAAWNAGLKFYAGTLDLTSGRYYEAPGNDKQIVEYVIASAMEPIVMPMRVIRPQVSKPPLWKRPKLLYADFQEYLRSKKPGHTDRDNSWLDGGLHNVAPLRAAIKEKNKEIVCIACRPDKIGRGSFRGRLAALGERVSDVVAQTLLDNDIAQALEVNKWVDLIQHAGAQSDVDKAFIDKFKKIDIRLIRPVDELDVDLRTFTPKDVERMIQTGHQDAAAAMKALPRERKDDTHKLGERAPVN